MMESVWTVLHRCNTNVPPHLACTFLVALHMRGNAVPSARLEHFRAFVRALIAQDRVLMIVPQLHGSVDSFQPQCNPLNTKLRSSEFVKHFSDAAY